jgi:MFS transporter, DHA3 family, macrolide efflux protein
MRKFFVLWSSQAASLFGSAIVQFALAWYLAKETGSATILSTAILVAIIPQITLGIFVGPFIDRWNRKWILIIADLVTALFTAWLVVLFVTKNIQVWHVYVAMVGRAAGQAFQNPALGASIPMIVPEKQLVRANGLFQMLQNGIQIVAPIAGAFFMGIWPMAGVLAIDIITAVIAVLTLLPIVIPQPVHTGPPVKPAYTREWREGFLYIWARPGLVMLMSLVFLLIFFASAPGSLFPVLVSKNLEGDLIKLGLFGTCLGIGGMLGGFIMGVWGGFKKKIMTALFGFFLLIPGSVVIGFTSPRIFYYTTLPALLIMGVGQTVINAPLTAIINAVVVKNMQGRVFSLYTSTVMIAIPLSLAIAGPVADAIGIQWLYWIAAAAWAIILPIAAFTRPLMELENHKAEKITLPETSGQTAG